MYVPKHFSAKELIPRLLYAKYQHRGDQWLINVLFDERLLKVADTLREEYGSMTINDWAWGGAAQFRGFRSGGCDVGATLSQHRFGRALDLIPKDINPREIRADILEDQMSPPYRDIGGLEMGIDWLHIDVRARTSGEAIYTFYP
jgi:hypothetical protein